MIDIKEIRIGNHLNHCVGYKCERVMVDEIMGGNQVAYITPDDDWAAVDAEDDWLQPIPLTAELLTELGFKKREGGLIWAKIFDGNCYVSFSPFEDNCWSLSITPKDCRKRSMSFVSNLHEAENIVYLTLRKELIEE